MLNEKGKPMTANEKSKLAYELLKDLTGEANPPGNDDFNDWVLRCMQAINEKLKTKPTAVINKSTTAANTAGVKK